MIGEFVSKHIYMCVLLLLGGIGVVIQGCVERVLHGYVKASDHMETTKKKNLLHLRKEFETIYGLECQVRNPKAYVEKYLLKLRFMGISYGYWDKLSELTISCVSVVAAGELLHAYWRNQLVNNLTEIIFVYGMMVACLVLAKHIYGVKSKKEQVQIQLIDYLENYVTNRLIKGKEMVSQTSHNEIADADQSDNLQPQMISEENQVAVAREEMEEESSMAAADAELLEEFVQSFLGA